MTALRRLTCLVVCTSLAGAVTAHADAVGDWNAITSQAIVTAGPARPGPSAILDFAVVHAAVYDAVQAIEGRYEPYHVVIPDASGSPAAATAKAAHDVLVNRFFAQTAALDATYHTYMAAHDLDENDPGVSVGEEAAAGIIALRANDGSFPAVFPPFTGGTAPGDWRPTPSYLPGPPPSGASMAAPWLAGVTPFTLTSPSQLRAPPPPHLTSGRYTHDYDEVKALGRDVDSDRTPEQTQIGQFWALNFVAQWNLALREIAAAHVDDIADSARLFALANLAAADSVITAWDSKRHYAFDTSWRPVTAIQEGDNDGNPRTDGDTNWKPLINTPNYPDYTSGANNFTASTTGILAFFFGTDNFTFVVRSNNPLASPPTRTYTRFSDAAQDVEDARIYQGIHFRFADAAGRKQGKHVAQWASAHFLRPAHNGQ